METSEKPGSMQLNLPAVFTINAVQELYQQWVTLALPADLTINASAVKEMDTAALQLLAVFVKSTLQNNKSIRWEPLPSSAFSMTVEECGLDETLFNIPKE